MSDIPRSEEVSEPVKKKKKRQRGYVKYAPLTLLFLSVCAFVFCFSLCGMYEQPMLDSVSKNELNNIYVRLPTSTLPLRSRISPRAARTVVRVV